jgi:Rps23 Pro-64 3,4-dihydroxylase Tpa1-like proline 4-hydroxylase
MNIFPIKEPFEHLIIEDVFTELEINDIWTELLFLYPKFKGPELIGSATDSSGTILKKTTGVFLEDVYLNQRESSHIIQYTSKILCDQKIQSIVSEKLGYYFRLLKMTNKHTTLVQYYENGNYYKPHHDIAVLSTVYTFYKQPKNFKGGNFYFSEYDYYVPIKNNKMIMFPSTVLHGVEEIKMSSRPKKECLGRFSISNFLWVNG